MSIASYRRNVRKGVTGPYIPTCFPAALEQISPEHSLRPGVYRDYTDFVRWYSELSKRRRQDENGEFETIINEVVAGLGGISCKDVIFKRAETCLGLKRIVNRLLAEDYRVAVDVAIGRGTHTVGLLPLPEPGYFILASTQLPKTLEGVVTLDHVAKRLMVPCEPHLSAYPFSDANITALPPV